MTKFIDKLSQEIYENEYFLELFTKLKTEILNTILKQTEDSLSIKELADLLRFADVLSCSDSAKAKNMSYDIIASLNNNYKSKDVYQVFSEAILTRLGNYPALDMFNSTNKLPLEIFLEKELKKQINMIPNTEEISFTDNQYILYKKILNNKIFSFSGPTSLGKSFLIINVIKTLCHEKKGKNIVILVPTKALISQYIKDLKENNREFFENNGYSISSNTNKEEKNGNIFVFTQERMNKYLSHLQHTIHYLFVDEAHNLSEENSRSPILLASISNAIIRNNNINLYFASPLIDNPLIFLEMFQLKDGNSLSIEEKTVSQNIFFVKNIKNKNNIEFFNNDIIPPILISNPYKEKWEMISKVGEKTSNLIYCNSIAKTFNYAQELKVFIKTNGDRIILEKSKQEEINKAQEIIRNTLHKDCYLIDCLNFGIGYHFASLPSTIRELIEDLFKKGIIKYLFCTSTLLQGVNLPSKNLFILSSKLGRSNLKDIDLWNLIGRAGRLKKELYGNIFCIKDNFSEWGKKNIERLKKNPKILAGNNLVYNNAYTINKNLDIENQNSKIKEAVNVLQYEILKENSQIKDTLKTILDPDIFSFIESNSKSQKIPKEILKKNNYINLGSLKNALNKIKTQEKIKSKFTDEVTYDYCLDILDNVKESFLLEKYENHLVNGNVLKYYGLMMSHWVSGKPLSEIIRSSIDWYSKTKSSLKIGYSEYLPYDGSIKHNNYIIKDVVECVNNTLGYHFQKYFNAHYSLLEYLYPNENIGCNWGEFLEYGTTNKVKIDLMNTGLNREVVNIILDKYVEFIEINKHGQYFIKKTILNELEKDTLEYKELYLFL